MPLGSNGLRIRGLAGDVDRVSVQSSESPSHLLTRRRWSFLPAKWTEVHLARDELMVLKCNDGEAVLEVKHCGGPHGAVTVDLGDDRRVRFREGQVLRLHMLRNRGVILRTEELRYPRTPGAQFMV